MQATSVHLTIIFIVCTCYNAAFAQAAQSAQLKLYWSGRYDTIIRRANLDGTAREDIVESAGGLVGDLDFDPVERKMYWPSPEAEGIQRSDYDGTNVETAVTGLVNPMQVAIDNLTRKIYWAEWGKVNSLWRSDLDGTRRELLADNTPPITGIEIDTQHGFYYWTEFLRGTVHRTSLDDNSDTEVIFDQFSLGDAASPRGLAVDPVHGYIYATDWSFDSVLRMGLDGSNPAIWLTEGVSNPGGIVVDLIDERVIWSNYSSGPQFLDDTNISSVDFDGGDQRIDFVPHSRSSPDNWVIQLAIVEVSVPEPGTFALLTTAILLFLVRSRSRFV